MAARCFAVNNNAANTVAQRGIYYSDDNGATWTQDTSKTLPTGASFTTGLANSFKLQTSTLWVITKANAFPIFYVSTDAGVTWTQNATIAVNPQDCWIDNDIQIVNSGSQIQTSTDNFVSSTTVTSAGGFNGNSIRMVTRNLRTNVFHIWTTGNNHYSSSDGISWTRHATPIADYTSEVNTANRYLGWNVNGVYYLYNTTTANHYGIVYFTDGGVATKTLDAIGAPTTSIVLAPAYNSVGRVSATDMYVHAGLGAAHKSSTGLAPWTTITGISDTAVPPIVRMDDGSYIDTNLWTRSTDSGSTWVLTTWQAGAVSRPISDQMISYVPHDLVAATPVERPHFTDRGLPIEIAGPRNDITRKAYLPNVRVFGA